MAAAKQAQNELWNLRRKNSPILFESRLKPSDLEKVKISIERELTPTNVLTIKRELPLVEFVDVESTLIAIAEFDSMTAEYAWWDYDYSYKYFRLVLPQALRGDWEIEVDSHVDNDGDVELSDANFQLCRNNMFRSILKTDAFDHFKTYLALLKRPDGWSARSTWQRLKTMVTYAEKLPNATPFSVNDLKRIITTMMPTHVELHIRRKWSDLDTVSHHEFLDYLETFDPNPNKRKDYSDGTEPTNKRLRGGGGNNGKKRNKNNKAMCRHHKFLEDKGRSNHPWSDCFLNSKSKNYDKNKADAWFEKRRAFRNRTNNGTDNARNATAQQQSYVFVPAPTPNGTQCPIAGQTFTIQQVPTNPNGHAAPRSVSFADGQQFIATNNPTGRRD